MRNKSSSQNDDLPADLSQPARRALYTAGCHSLEQIAAYSEDEVKKMHGIGPKAIASLRRDLAARGLSFASKKEHPGK